MNWYTDYLGRLPADNHKKRHRHAMHYDNDPTQTPQLPKGTDLPARIIPHPPTFLPIITVLYPVSYLYRGQIAR
ncbi:hypothetical protein K445DRAFT_175721 [Daldinia sp. EC12]|nr:hypothetical protein F4774DRAFT_271974 [Daldinia eschscholtzii]OTB12798.1 hypothetical protein K445DRAFT_175721 [Daldinia sp. EC12]